MEDEYMGKRYLDCGDCDYMIKEHGRKKLIVCPLCSHFNIKGQVCECLDMYNENDDLDLPKSKAKAIKNYFFFMRRCVK